MSDCAVGAYNLEDPLADPNCIELTHGDNDSAPDMVNHPSHYADKEIEVIDYIRDTLTPEEFTGYCMGNVLKYCSRWRKKDGVQDLEKAQVYLGWGAESARNEKR